MKVTWLTQAGLLFEGNGISIMVDPYLSDSVAKIEPKKGRRMPIDAKYLAYTPDVILITHEHRLYTFGANIGHHLIAAALLLYPLLLRQALQLIERTTQISLLARLKQIVDTINLEGLQGILVVGRRKYNRYLDIDTIKYAERVSIRKVNIHKDHIGIYLAREVLYALLHRLQHLDNLNIGLKRCEHATQVYLCSCFVLNNYYSFHHLLGFRLC